MSFTLPKWSSTHENYTIEITHTTTFEYVEIRESSGANFYHQPDVEVPEFKKVIEEIAKQIHIQGAKWFASPIKPAIFLKRVRNIFAPIPEKNYGKTCFVTWSPYLLKLHSNYYELVWKVSVSKKEDILPTSAIEYSDELNEPIEERVQLQSNPAEISEIELLENEVLPSLNTMEISSRAAMKKKIRETRLKAAVLALKAEKLAEKYFKRYGNYSTFEYESDLSLNSDEEESEESETQ